MPIDTTPSTVATNALQAIPFAALIGGPLDACIKAQASAAKTSWEFINQVGLTIDPKTGEKKAINVTFQYNNNGHLTTLVVPLLVLVPIPYLAIDKVSIDFLANISAGSSSVSETSSDTELGVDVTAEASLNVGPFSMKINASANYSSKQHSKASQESSYSVEYTMGVHVEGGQADMPAGLTTVLNILQGSISSVSDSDSVTIAPASLSFNKKQTATLQVIVKDTQGVFAPGVKVNCVVVGDEKDNPFEPVQLLKGQTVKALKREISSGMPLNKLSRSFIHHYPHESRYQLKAYTGTALVADLQDTPEVGGLTDKNGSITFLFKLKDSVYQGTEMLQANIIVNADVPKVGTDPQQFNNEPQSIIASIIPQGPVNVVSAPEVPLTFKAISEEQKLKINISDPTQTGVADTRVTIRVTASPSADKVFGNIKTGTTAGTSPSEATGTTDSDGNITFALTTLATLTEGQRSWGEIKVIAANTPGMSIPLNVVIAKKPAVESNEAEEPENLS